MDTRDWIIVISTAGIQLAATVFLFKHPDPVNFATWAAVCGTLAGVYHLLVVRDSKEKDAT
jgi:O-antigen/teichoic acid export membrane protein